MNSSHNLFAIKIVSFAFPKEFVAVKSATRNFFDNKAVNLLFCIIFNKTIQYILLMKRNFRNKNF